MPTDREDWPEGWSPPFRTLERGSGLVVFAETPSGPRLSVATPQPPIERFTDRLADWLEAKLAALPESELMWPVSFVYVVVSAQLQPDGSIHVTEFGHGAAPAAPVEWLVRPSRSVVLAAVHALRGQRSALRTD
jgi:hypothetical protein